MFKWVSALLGQGEEPAARPGSDRVAGGVHHLEEVEEGRALGEIVGPWTLGRGAAAADPSQAREGALVALADLGNEFGGGAEQAFLMRLGQTIAAEDLSLPQFPDVARELNELMSDPRTDASRLGRLVERDPSLVQRVWTQATSARYRRPPEGLHEAIARVGTSQLWRIAMRAAFDAAVFKVPGYQDEAEAVRIHGYVAAEVAAWMAGEMRGPAYLSGLLHDVGKLIIFRSAGGGPAPDPRLVHKVVNEHHAAVGVLVGAAWQMEGAVGAALGFHHAPAKAPEKHRKLAWVVHVADIVSHRATAAREGRELPGLQALADIPGLKINSAEALEQADNALDRFTAPQQAAG